MKGPSLTRFAATLAWLGLFVAAMPCALAAERSAKDEAKVEVEKAQLHYKLGRFEEALNAYTRAYEIYHAPALLFNIGQCHKNLKNYERAIFFFEGYLREETDPKKRQLAEELIEKSRADLQRRRYEPPTLPAEATAPATNPSVQPDDKPAIGNKTSTSTSGPVAGSGAGTTVVVGPLSAPEPLVDRGETPPPTPLTRRWWFWTAVGVGVLALAGGGWAYYASGDTNWVTPSGTVGTLDRR